MNRREMSRRRWSHTARRIVAATCAQRVAKCGHHLVAPRQTCRTAGSAFESEIADVNHSGPKPPKPSELKLLSRFRQDPAVIDGAPQRTELPGMRLHDRRKTVPSTEITHERPRRPSQRSGAASRARPATHGRSRTPGTDAGRSQGRPASAGLPRARVTLRIQIARQPAGSAGRLSPAPVAGRSLRSVKAGGGRARIMKSPVAGGCVRAVHGVAREGRCAR